MDGTETLFNAETREVERTSEAAIRARREAEKYVPPSPSFLDALEKAVGEMPVWIKQDAEADQGKYTVKYATLKQILTVVRPILLKHNIRIRQGANPSWVLDGGGIKGRLVPIYTDLLYSPTGDTDRTLIEIPVTRLDAQAMGSAISYGRRYSLLAALGLATDEADDDGKRAASKDITDPQNKSQVLWILEAEIDEFTDASKLKSWAEKLKASRRADELEEGEAALLRKYYNDALHKLAGVKK